MTVGDWTVREHAELVDHSSQPVRNAWLRPGAASTPALGEDIDGVVYQAGDGGALRQAVVDVIDGASDMVVIATFILASEHVERALLAAAGRGVRVYLLTASEMRLQRSPPPWAETDVLRVNQHMALLDRLAGQALVRTASGFHLKAVIADPRTQPRGLVSTANFVDVDLEANTELAVRLTAGEVQALFHVLRWHFWEGSQHELLRKGMLRAITPLGSVNWHHPTGPVLTMNRHGDQISDRIVELLGSSERIVMSNFGWAADHPVVAAACAAAQRGYAVSVLARAAERAKNSAPALLELADAGVQVIGHPRMHAKVVWVPQGRAIVHTMNFMHAHDDHQLEVGVELDGERADLVGRVVGDWLNSGAWRLQTTARLAGAGDRVIDVTNGGWNERRVVAVREVRLPDLVAPSADDLDLRPTFPQTNGDDNGALARATRYSWIVKAPRLARGARLVERDVAAEPSLYEEPSGRRVVAITAPSQLPAAQVLAQRVGAAAVVVTKPSGIKGRRP